MTAQQREAARLYVVDGKTQVEIAAAYGVTQSAVSKWFALEDVAALIDELEAAADEHCVKVAAHNLRSNTARLCRIAENWANSLDNDAAKAIGYTLGDADARYKQNQGYSLALSDLHGIQDRLLNRRKVKQAMRFAAEERAEKREVHQWTMSLLAEGKTLEQAVDASEEEPPDEAEAILPSNGR